MLTTSGKQFILDGNPFRIISGSMHYFRVPHEYWRERMEKMVAFGLNTLETYVCWNLHEPHPGEFHFDGDLDIVRYIQSAAELGLKVIMRPGPYICSEWEFGGLPYWLLKDPNMQVRCMYKPYLDAHDRFFDALLPRLIPLQDTHNGPIIAMQIENEYGGYGQDHEYMEYVKRSMTSRGVDVLLFTSDGARDTLMQGGSLPGVLQTVNFPFFTKYSLNMLHKYQPDAPTMVAEFWSGWFDHWGERHHLTAGGIPSIWPTLDAFNKILASGASVNFYMFHGGTNFGFMNGANTFSNSYQADVTSYDYACPLDEAGDPSRRYFACRKILGKFVQLPNVPLPTKKPKKAYGKVEMKASTGLFDNLITLSKKHLSLTPGSMESYDQDYGFILYRTHIGGPRPKRKCIIDGLHDRALIFLNGVYHTSLERAGNKNTTSFSVPENGCTLDILVENMGRVNYGPWLLDRKGILGGVIFDEQLQFHWEVFPLPLTNVTSLSFEEKTASTYPGFFKGTFTVDDPVDTFLALPGWNKGVAWINGRNLGRYWKRGPQKSLYLPAPWLKKGTNEIILFELYGSMTNTVELRDKHDLG